MVPGAFEILLVLFVILLVIGPRRIANLGRALGRGVRDFRVEFGRDKKSPSALSKDKKTSDLQSPEEQRPKS